VSWEYEGWLNFNVTRALYLWTYLPHTNLGLYMKVIHLDEGKCETTTVVVDAIILNVTITTVTLTKT